MHWKTIGVLGKPLAAEQSVDTFKELHTLFDQWHLKALFEDQVGQLLNLPKNFCLPAEQLIQEADLILVVGGDGSMLRAARLAVEYNKPLLGVNRGHLGFLTDIGPEELSQRLHAVLEGNFWSEPRSLLQASIHQNNTKAIQATALNDIVLSLGEATKLIEFDLWIDDIFVCRQRADGLIITTPTGSTAYSLSAGGPILHPQLNALAIVPMLPHKLTSRPLVVSNASKIKILLRNHSDSDARLSFDSQQRFNIDHNTTIEIQRYHKLLQLIHPMDYDYFQTLRNKLHWESR